MNGSVQALTAVARHLSLVWAGLVIGVSFLATPAKFLAPSLSLAAALDVGRQTFFVLNRAELVLGAALVALGCSRARSLRALVWAVPGCLAAVQGAWLLPVLDARVQQVLEGAVPPRSAMHALYIGVELAKLGALLALGLVAHKAADEQADQTVPASVRQPASDADGTAVARRPRRAG